MENLSHYGAVDNQTHVTCHSKEWLLVLIGLWGKGLGNHHLDFRYEDLKIFEMVSMMLCIIFNMFVLEKSHSCYHSTVKLYH